MSRRDVSEIEQALTGCRYEKDEIRKALNQFQLEEYFGGITEDEVLSGITE